MLKVTQSCLLVHLIVTDGTQKRQNHILRLVVHNRSRNLVLTTILPRFINGMVILGDPSVHHDTVQKRLSGREVVEDSEATLHITFASTEPDLSEVRFYPTTVQTIFQPIPHLKGSRLKCHSLVTDLLCSNSTYGYWMGSRGFSIRGNHYSSNFIVLRLYRLEFCRIGSCSRPNL